MEREIITADGERRTVEGDSITEFNGSVFVFPETATAVGVLTGEADYDKYEGATLA